MPEKAERVLLVTVKSLANAGEKLILLQPPDLSTRQNALRSATLPLLTLFTRPLVRPRLRLLRACLRHHPRSLSRTGAVNGQVRAKVCFSRSALYHNYTTSGKTFSRKLQRTLSPEVRVKFHGRTQDRREGQYAVVLISRCTQIGENGDPMNLIHLFPAICNRPLLRQSLLSQRSLPRQCPLSNHQRVQVNRSLLQVRPSHQKSRLSPQLTPPLLVYR